jgi:hypothetical protein
MPRVKLAENELWILSFYRISELSGALFFGRLARSLSGPVQKDMTKHFADESQHAWYWTSCIARLGAEPLKLSGAYQDQYLGAAGMPANLMEVLALTQVFERRVIHQYALHSQVPKLRAEVAETIARIMDDEKWHIEWVAKALRRMEGEYGREQVKATLERFSAADREVYAKTVLEHEERIRGLIPVKSGRRGNRPAPPPGSRSR